MIQSLQVDLMVKRIIVACMILIGANMAQAQDYHFTDFRMAPSFINPALTGAFKGTYRVNGIYRDQWRSFGNNNPYKTFLLSADINIKAGVLLDNDWVSGGLSLLSDQAGVGGLKTTVTGLLLGYHLGLDKDYKQVVSAGINYGNASISATGFTRFSEITGNEQPSYRQSGGSYLPSNLQQNNPNGPGGADLSIGFTYKTETDDGDLIRFGIALDHLNGRDASVIAVTGDSTGVGGNPPLPNPNPNRKLDPVNRNLILYGEGSTLMSSRVRLNPSFLFMTAGGHTQFQLQSTVDYLVNPKEQFSLTGGVGMRVIPFDAAYLMAGVKIKDLRVRLSYDLTLSSLRDLGGGNSFELSVGYIGRIYRDAKSDKVIFCPRL